jgi:hypothetical protein
MTNKTAAIMLLFFAACTTPPHSQLTTADSLQMIDQMQKKVNTISAQLHADCDSALLQEAKYKADSIRMKKSKHSSRLHSSKK